MYLTYLDVMLVMLCVQHIWMLCCLSYCVFDIFGCYAACHVVCSTYLDVMLLVMLCIDIFGRYCHVVYLTYLNVMSLVMLCF